MDERIVTFLGWLYLLFFNKLNMKPLLEEIVDYKWKELKHGFENKFETKVKTIAYDCIYIILGSFK